MPIYCSKLVTFKELCENTLQRLYLYSKTCYKELLFMPLNYHINFSDNKFGPNLSVILLQAFINHELKFDFLPDFGN